MNLQEWSKSDLDYGRRLLNSGWEGALSGSEECLHGEPLAPFLGNSARNAVSIAALGACLGLFGSLLGKRKSAIKAVALGVSGGLIGFSVGLAWESRQLGASAVSGAWKNVSKVRDERWFEKNPIDYA